MAGEKLIVDNRRARFDYELLERFEAGLVLTGTEVKSLRQGRGLRARSMCRTRHTRHNGTWIAQNPVAVRVCAPKKPDRRIRQMPA